MPTDQLIQFFSNLNLIVNIILAIIIPLIFLKIVNRTVQKFVKEESISSSSLKIFSKLLRYVIFVIIVLAVLEILGIDFQSLIISVGIVSIAFTMATKDTLSNVISGIILLIEKRFVVGDIIEIDGHMGQVKKIGFKSVELYYKKKYTVIPNILFSTKPFINHTRNGYYEIKIPVKLLNRYDVEEKISQIEVILEESDLILDEPHFIIRLKSITTAGVDVTIKAYISDPNDDIKVISEIIKKIKKEVVLEDMY